MEDIIKQVINAYKETSCVSQVSKQVKLSNSKVRKILITEGLFSNRISEQAALLKAHGRTREEIAKILAISVNSVSSYLPYERGQYNLDEKTSDANKSSLYRERIACVKERILGYNTERETITNKKVVSTHHPICLHFSLAFKDWDGINIDNEGILTKYGQSATGFSIDRDVLVPSDITLHNLSYVILKCFGWQNSHLHQFTLPEDVHNKITEDKVEKWFDLVGLLFYHCIDYDNDPKYDDDDYQSGSFKKWIKSKYTGPYLHGPWFTKPKVMKNAIIDFLTREMQYYVFDINDRANNERYGRIMDENISNVKGSYELFYEELQEDIVISDILAIEGQPVHDSINNVMVPITHSLIYKYDFGDGWEIEITRKADCSALLKDKKITKQELLNAEKIVYEKHAPVCICKEGAMLMDDVGGIYGFLEFLKDVNVNNGINSDNLDIIYWAKSLGWKKNRT